jgi:hypothetical protein
MVFVVGTLSIMHLAEIVDAQSCDYRFNDVAKGLIQTLGCATLYANKRIRLFPRLAQGHYHNLRGIQGLHFQHLQRVGAALTDIGVNAAGSSGVCCRMGGLTVAIEAGIPEHILWCQSGHAQDHAAHLQDPDKLASF